MKKSVARAPAARTVLRAYPPAPARVDLDYRPLSGRLARTALALAICWGPIPWAVWVPPHYPWPILLLCVGAYAGWRSWTGRWRVRAFAGLCPRCGRHLRIEAGTSIDLPHTLTCYGCHFEPVLEVDVSGRRPLPPVLPPAEPWKPVVRHLSAECTGRWEERWFRDDAYVGCARCGARFFATKDLRAQAAAENDRGALLARLAEEGRFLDPG